MEKIPSITENRGFIFRCYFHGQLAAVHVDIMNNWQSVDLDDSNIGALGCLEPGNLESGDLEPGNSEECRVRAFFAQNRFGYHARCRSAGP
jgi:hypothetical protein